MPTRADISANYILASLPGRDAARLQPHLEAVDLTLNDVLCEPNRPSEYVHFPADSLVALLYTMEDGSSAEVAVIGNDGMVGIAHFMGGGSMPGTAVTQAAGKSFRMSAQTLKMACLHNSALHDLLLRYTQSLMTQMAQTEVCNRYHSIDQQLCRWLLLSLDRLPGNRLLMTHNLISGVLGRRRAGVSEAAARLQRLGAIRYSWGHIEVCDRTVLEERVCECYATVRDETIRLHDRAEGVEVIH